MTAFTLIVPYYRNPKMLARQVREWNSYPEDVRIVVVDDGSPEAALPVIEEEAAPWIRYRLQLYRIEVDLPWNREGARNLGAKMASDEWIVHVDIDHVLPVHAADALLQFKADPRCWYRFPRWRVGRADETRRKDRVPESAEFAQIHPHIDSYLVRRELYWEAGGYDEDFSGCLGGGTEFLRRLERCAPVEIAPESVCLHVHTRHSVKDASDWSLSRDTTEGKRRARAKPAGSKPISIIRFPWSRQL